MRGPFLVSVTAAVAPATVVAAVVTAAVVAAEMAAVATPEVALHHAETSVRTTELGQEPCPAD